MSTGRPPLPPSAARSTALTVSSGPPLATTGESKALATSAGSSALVEYKPLVVQPEDEDLEVKLRRIIDNVPVRVSNTSGSSAGSGSGDFHQYRQMRRKEQDRLARMDVDYQRRKEEAEFFKRREERLKAAEERTAKKRLKRQKKKEKKKEKKIKLNVPGEDHKKQESSSESDSDHDNAKLK